MQLKRMAMQATNLSLQNTAINSSYLSKSIYLFQFYNTHIHLHEKRNRLERYYKRMDTIQVIIYLHRKANHQKSGHLNTNLRTFNFIKYSLTLCCLKNLIPDTKIPWLV